MASAIRWPNRSWRISVTPPGTTDSSIGSDELFHCSSDPSLIQTDALGAALGSQMMWWSSPLDDRELATIVQNCICLGVYDESEAKDNGKPAPMIGFCRLVTDHITFAYLTDVYVLPAYQRRGLGAWLMRCLREYFTGDADPKNNSATPEAELAGKTTHSGWPSLRSLWLVASTPAAARMYTTALNMEQVARYRSTEGDSQSGMIMLEMVGPANGPKKHLDAHGTITPY